MSDTNTTQAAESQTPRNAALEAAIEKARARAEALRALGKTGKAEPTEKKPREKKPVDPDAAAKLAEKQSMKAVRRFAKMMFFLGIAIKRKLREERRAARLAGLPFEETDEKRREKAAAREARDAEREAQRIASLTKRALKLSAEGRAALIDAIAEAASKPQEPNTGDDEDDADEDRDDTARAEQLEQNE